MRNNKLCALAWIHLHVTLEGYIAPCCQYSALNVDDEHELKKATEYSIAESINSPGMKKMRVAMLNNDNYQLCSTCDRMEDLGIDSARVLHNKRYMDSTLEELIASTAEDGSIDPALFEPKFVDLRFNNTCNLKCRTCSHGASSAWYEEEQLLRKEYGFSLLPPTSKFNKNNLLDDTLQYLDNVERVYWAGGEPLILPEHYTILKYIIDSGNASNIELAYNTNLTTSSYKKVDLYEYWKNFKEVAVVCSIDGMDSVAEYVRTGGVWDEFKATFETLKQYESKNQAIHVHPCFTVSILNIHQIYDFAQWCFENKWIPKHIPMLAINLVDNPKEFCLHNLPREEKDLIRERHDEFMDWLDEFGSPESKDTFYRIIAFMYETTPDDVLEWQNKCIDKLNLFDRTGNLDWKTSLPLLVDYYQRYDIL